MPAVSAVIVCYDEEPADIRSALDHLLSQTRPPDEILVVDNGDGTLATAVEGHAPHVRPLRPGGNLGYPPAINFAAGRATGDYLFCLNPDASTDSRCLELLLQVAESDAEIAVVGAQILLPDGETTNGGHNPLHPLGISPAGNWGKPREDGEPRDVMVVAGTCCLMRRDTFLALGGFVDAFFLYYDDADYCWRANIAGRRVVYCPAATMLHDPEFARRGRKWFFLERNRIFSVLSNYERRTLVRLAPLFLVSELGLLGIAAVQGWLPQKLEAYRSIVSLRRTLLDHRRRVQAARMRSDPELLPLFTPRLESPFLPDLLTRLAGRLTTAYLRVL
ncbi:MAG: glycosyltransferase family 2 protein [Gaiellaceae bacterium]